MIARRFLRAVVGLAGVVTLASVARADAPGDQYGLFAMNDVTIDDVRTKLSWQRYPSFTKYDFGGAAAYCQSLSLGSYPSGWRVPSYKELLTLVDEQPHLDYSSGAPVQKAIDPNAFPSLATPVDAPYWTSSYFPGSGGTEGYAVKFGDGTATSELTGVPMYVRCVHD